MDRNIPVLKQNKDIAFGILQLVLNELKDVLDIDICIVSDSVLVLSIFKIFIPKLLRQWENVLRMFTDSSFESFSVLDLSENAQS